MRIVQKGRIELFNLFLFFPSYSFLKFSLVQLVECNMQREEKLRGETILSKLFLYYEQGPSDDERTNLSSAKIFIGIQETL